MAKHMAPTPTRWQHFGDQAGPEGSAAPYVTTSAAAILPQGVRVVSLGTVRAALKKSDIKVPVDDIVSAIHV